MELDPQYFIARRVRQPNAIKIPYTIAYGGGMYVSKCCSETRNARQIAALYKIKEWVDRAIQYMEQQP